MQVVIFRLKDEQFAVETDKVQSINDTMEITKVPNAPYYIKGLINLRGNVISLLDINLLLDIDKGEKDQNNIIILNIEEEMLGITVDQVDEVLDVEESLIEKLDDVRRKAYVKGVINFKDRIVTLIDIDKLLLNQ
ncbi:chemotaxis protein CheW [uncultured Clostridium sp.]|uniref:chemotaxis protein CheW n=1 Tax=uncultured Clostridium sp. TaxID=59620 RepID=UPI0028EE99B1|nr:chemotaxis protein CheW [uncultured Clostridium sp.]